MGDGEAAVWLDFASRGFGEVTAVSGGVGSEGPARASVATDGRHGQKSVRRGAAERPRAAMLCSRRRAIVGSGAGAERGTRPLRTELRRGRAVGRARNCLRAVEERRRADKGGKAARGSGGGWRCGPSCARCVPSGFGPRPPAGRFPLDLTFFP